MFCPGCAVPVNDNTKFCKSCGANLRGVREALTARGEPFDWSKTWVAELFLTEEEYDRRRGVTPEQKRLSEIRAGVITTLAGVGGMIFLYFFLGAVADNATGQGAEIIRRVWLAGIVPFLVGLGLLINGIFLSKHQLSKHRLSETQANPALPTSPASAPGHTTNQLGEAPLTPASITEQTTAHLTHQPAAAYVSRRETETG